MTASRAARRRARREAERAARYETATTTGWCEREDDLPELRNQLRTVLHVTIGARRRSPTRTYTYAGVEAEKHLALLIEKEPESQRADAYRDALGKLSERGGFIATAAADVKAAP